MTTLRKLSQKKYRDREGLYLVEGASALRDAILSDQPPVMLLYEDRANDREVDNHLLELALERKVPVRELTDGELVRISGLKTAPPVAGIFALPEAHDPIGPGPGEVVLALDRVMDPGNLGTLIRSALFYGVHDIWLGEGTADPFNPKVVRASMGAQLHARLCRNVKLEHVLAAEVQRGTRVLATDMDGNDRFQPVASGSPPAILLLGNEPAGVAPGLITVASEHVAITRRGPVDSLNVAMAGAILLDRLLAR